jgi:hypothetical protein
VAAIYTEAGLAGNTQRLTAAITDLTDTVGRLDRIHEQMGGSSRVLARNLDKAQAETREMRHRLEGLQEFTSEEQEVGTGTDEGEHGFEERK